PLDAGGESPNQSSNTGPPPPPPAGPPAHVDASVATLGPSQLFEPLQKRCQVSLAQLRLGAAHKHADTTPPFALLRRRGHRPRGRATDQRHECPSPHDRSSGTAAYRVI